MKKKEKKWKEQAKQNGENERKTNENMCITFDKQQQKATCIVVVADVTAAIAGARLGQN